MSASGFQFLFRRLDLRLSGLQFLTGLFQRRLTSLKLFPAAVVLIPSGRQGTLAGLKLSPSVVHLRPGRFDLAPAVRDRLTGVGQLYLTVLKLLFRVLKFPLSVLVLLTSISQFLFAVLQFFPGIGQLLIRFLPAVFQFFFRIGDLFLRLRHNLVISDPAPFLLNTVYIFLQTADQAVISVCITCGPLHPMGADIDLRIYLLVKILRKNIGKSVDLAGSQRGIAPVKRYIHGASADPGHCICFCFQIILVFRFLQGKGIAQLISLPVGKIDIKKTLPAFFGQFSFQYGKLVGLLRHGFYMKNLPGFFVSAEHICGIGTFGCFHSLCVPEGFHITVCKSQSSHNLQIHQLRLRIIGVSGHSHIR